MIGAMNMHLFLIVLINAGELVVLDSLFCAKIEKRNLFWLRCAACAAIVLLYGLFAPLEKMRFLFHFPAILASFLYIGFCYRNTFRTTLFLGIASYAIQRLGSVANSVISVLLPDTFNFFSMNSPAPLLLGYALVIACDAVVYTIAYFVIIRKLRFADIAKKATKNVILLTGIVLVANQFWSFGMGLYGESYRNTTMNLIEYGWTTAVCVLCLAVQFGIFTTGEKDKELSVARRIIAEKEQQYKLSKSSIDAINRKCHDLKYQLAALQNGGDQQKHIDEAMLLVESFDSAIHTGNDTLDVIFTEKNFYCKKHQITFVCMIDGQKLNFMDVTDQYVLFGNIIDNAINAVRKIREYERRSIYINVHAEKKLLLIQTENPFIGSLTFVDGLPQTTSGDELNHGFGMQSIRLIAEKYGGSVNTRAEGNVFYLNVLIPIQ